ncbi:MAG: four helix bundle protein [Phycisphaerales bacterium]|jgi:four helix bundle protein
MYYLQQRRECTERNKKTNKRFRPPLRKTGCFSAKNSLGDHINKQLIRCSTSVAANYRAACVAQSRAHFISKLGIVVEEVDEACFWLGFVIDENLLKENRVLPLLDEAKELASVFISARKTSRLKNNK